MSIDLRRHGSRGSGDADLDLVRRDPAVYAEGIRGTVADLRSAIDVLAGPVAVAGVSLSGAIATILAATDERVRAAAIMSTPGRWSAVLQRPAVRELLAAPPDPGWLALARRTLSPLDPVRYIGRVAPRPVLLVSGLEDDIVVVSTARALQAAARGPTAVIEHGGGHDPFAGRVGEANLRAVASFLHRHLTESR